MLFKYTAINQQGKMVRGSIDTPTTQAAIRKLQAEKLWVMKIIDPSKSIWRIELQWGGPKIKTEVFTAFCRQLATMYRSGIGLSESISIMAKQIGHKVFS